MKVISNTVPPGRWSKLKRRVSQGQWNELPTWSARWLYWNAGFSHILPPSRLKELRRSYRYHRPVKKYGVRDPIIVYQMGKVASTSVFRTLQSLDLDVPVYQLHFLNDLDMFEQELRRVSPDPSLVPHAIKVARDIRSEMERAPRQKWSLISLVRAPIPRAVSGFFEKLEEYFPSCSERVECNELSLSEVADYFVNSYQDRMPNQWFESQVRDLFGIDVYASEFPKTRGYQIYEKGNIRMLVIRSEDLNQRGATALREFLGLPNFRLVNDNVGEQKQYAGLYRNFLDVLRLPPEYIKEWNTTRYARHFYTTEELAHSVRRWM